LGNWGAEVAEIKLAAALNCLAYAPIRLGNGFGHIALGVPDVYKGCDEFRARGVKVVKEPGSMKHSGNAIAFLEDPNGYKIELTTRAE
jgi:lactoylglutathione lyase